MLNYLKSRAGEVTSIWSAAGLSGIVAVYLLGQITLETAIVGAAVAVVGYVLPRTKGSHRLSAMRSSRTHPSSRALSCWRSCFRAR